MQGTQDTRRPAEADGPSLLADLLREARHYPKATVLAEFATFGPVLNIVVGGRRGVPRHRQGVQRDEQRFIPMYRRTLQVLLADVPGGSRLMPAVDWAIGQDHQENANLLAAFDLLDPDGDQDPRVLAATRYTAPAAGHAAAKFAALSPALVLAVGALARGWAHRWRTSHRRT